jgi:hypothetical protein
MDKPLKKGGAAGLGGSTEAGAARRRHEWLPSASAREEERVVASTCGDVRPGGSRAWAAERHGAVPSASLERGHGLQVDRYLLGSPPDDRRRMIWISGPGSRAVALAASISGWIIFLYRNRKFLLIASTR